MQTEVQKSTRIDTQANIRARINVAIDENEDMQICTQVYIHLNIRVYIYHCKYEDNTTCKRRSRIEYESENE